VAGLRCDGMYAVRSFGLKLEQDTEIYTMTVLLQRSPLEKPLQEILAIPRPSQLDDWKLYQMMEEREMQRVGLREFIAWKMKQEEARIELEH